MKIFLFILTFFVIIGLLLSGIYQVKQDAGQQATVIKQEATNTLIEYHQQWQARVRELERAKKELEQRKKEAAEEARLRIAGLQARIAQMESLKADMESLKADYEKKLAGQKDCWQQEISKIKTRNREEREQKVKTLLEQAGQMREEADFLEALKYYGQVLALAPDEPEAREGWQQVELEINAPAEKWRLKSSLKRLQEKSQKQIDKLTTSLEQEKENARRLKEEMDKGIETLKAQLQAERQTGLNLVQSKETLAEQNRQINTRWEKARERWQEQEKQIKEDARQQLAIERDLWQSLLARLEDKRQEEMKAQEELWQERLKSVNKQSQKRIQALEEEIEKKVLAERQLWQERLEALQDSLVNTPRQSQTSVANTTGETNKDINFYLGLKEDTGKTRINLPEVDKKEALDLLDQAIVYIGDEDYQRAQDVLEKSIKLDPENKMSREILARLRVLLKTKKW